MDDTPEIKIDELILDDEGIGMVPEYFSYSVYEAGEQTMYVVVDYEKSEIFGMYVVVLFSVLITYPIIRLVMKALDGGGRRWR